MREALDEIVGAMLSQRDVYLTGAARGVWQSPRFWPALTFVAALTALGLLMPSGGGWDLLSAAAATLASGYQLSISRCVFDGGPVLPPLAGWTPMVRRALSLSLILLALLVLPWIVLVLAVVKIWPDRPQVVISVLTAVVFTPPAVIASSQYIAFDRLREGFRYRQAWRRFRSHSRAGLRVVGYLLLAELLWVLVYAALTQLGSARTEAEVVLALLYAPLLLIGAHLQGQYVAVAYVRERPRDSV